MGVTKIDWTDVSWNPVTGCTKISAGCKFCYAERMAERLKAMGQEKYKNGFDITTHPQTLAEPLRWHKPRRVFVCSMGDLFHDRVPDLYIAAVFGVMAICRQHTFQVLTKRPERMREWFEWAENDMKGRHRVAAIAHHAACVVDAHSREHADQMYHAINKMGFGYISKGWPLPNVWALASCEDRDALNKRVPDLLQVPAVVHGVSLEPMLEGVRLKRRWLESGGAMAKDGGRSTLSWVIVGSESGPKARPFDEAWASSIRDQCVEAGIAFYYKQRPKQKTRGIIHKPRLDGRCWTQFPEVSND